MVHYVHSGPVSPLNGDVKRKVFRMAITNGNWSVVPNYTDTITSTKNLPLPDLDYAVDYSVRNQKNGETVIINKTGASVAPIEMIRYAQSRVANVYESGLIRDLNIAPSAQSNCAEGIKVYSEIATTFKATNTVSGEEITLPFRVSVAAVTPSTDIVPSAAYVQAVIRGLSTMFGTGEVDGTLAKSLARGDTNPVDDSGSDA